LKASLNSNGFADALGGFVWVCKKATLGTEEEGAANPTKNSVTLEVHPSYTECIFTVQGTTKGSAEIVTTGCNYVFHAATPGQPTATTDIKCTTKALASEVTEKSKVIKVSSTTGIVPFDLVTGPKIKSGGKGAENSFVEKVISATELELNNAVEGAGTATVKETVTSTHTIQLKSPMLTGCTIFIPAQTALIHTEVKNEPAGPPGEMTINLELEKIEMGTPEGCNAGKLSVEGESREGEELEGKAKLAAKGKPAKFQAKAKAGVAADPIEVGLNEPHWYKNRAALAESLHVLMWGIWPFSSSGEIGAGMCYTEWEGTISNPGGAGNNAPAGEGKIEGFRADDCEDATCEAQGSKLAVYPTNLGLEINPGSVVKREWEDKLATAAGKTRLQIGNKTEGSQQAGLTFYCEQTGKGGFKQLPHGELSPEVENGTAVGSAPARLLFGAGSGALEIGPGLNVGFTGSVKMMGYEGEEVISTKNP
jgi:hypothetical protein